MMVAADRAVQRPRDARLLMLDAQGRLRHLPRHDLPRLLRVGDLLVANDAATLPASLAGRLLPNGEPVELRLAGRASLRADDVQRFQAVLFGAGDHRTPTEQRPAPPPVRPGDLIRLAREGRGDPAARAAMAADDAPLYASVVALLDHPRLLEIELHGTPDAIWAGIARHGRPVQYAHLREPLALWDVWTPLAARPVAFEPPSAGFMLDWALVQGLRERGVGLATLTHAAGLSSTGDPALDARLPLPEPYEIPSATAAAVAQARRFGGRVIAVGTTVARALEHAAGVSPDGTVPAGAGIATQRLGAHSSLQVVDVLLSGTHEPGTSHHDLLRAFIDADDLRQVDRALSAGRYRTHEFGDSVWIAARRVRSAGERGQHRAQRQQRGEGRHGLEGGQGDVLHGAKAPRAVVQTGLQTACAP
jgi:S-adenosylmethionine:tRNA ribosyltransferase-isomerase